MTPRNIFALVVLVACAHGLVHLYELSLPSVEQQIATEFYGEEVEAGKAMTGLLSNSWRLTWGLGALAAGWLVDRFGARRMLAIYLLGCSAMCAAVTRCFDSTSMFVVMTVMGTFASIYHPAGLALLSHHTTPENRPRALGLHGVLGSAGIGGAPLFAWIVTSCGYGWRPYYLLMAIPGGILGCYFLATMARDREQRPLATDKAMAKEEDESVWGSFALLALISVLQGFIYAAMMSFLPRYLSTGDDGSAFYGLLSRCGLLDSAGVVNGQFVAALVLLCGCLGQYISGRLAKPRLLERQMATVFFAIAPFLLWMAIAQGTNRMIAAGLFAIVHFMHQPLYSSLIAKYSPASRRSLCYGFSFAMGLGVGSFGASFNGFSTSEATVYIALAGIAVVAGLLTMVLERLNRIAASS